MGLFWACMLLLLQALAQPLSLSNSGTPTSTVTPTRSPLPSTTPLCPSSLCATYTYTYLPQKGFAFWQVGVNVSYLYVNLWGSGGGSSYVTGGNGAFVSGALRVTSGEILRIIVGSLFDSEENGCGGAATFPRSYENHGGGRSAVQRLYGSTYVDVVTAGGGGGGRIGGSASSSFHGQNGDNSVSIANDGAGGWLLKGNCIVGVRGCGSSESTSGGGGGFCGGVGSEYGGGGGGCSFSSNLTCTYLADSLIGNLPVTPFPGGGAGMQGNEGLVVISSMPPDWQPCAPLFPSASPSGSLSVTFSCTISGSTTRTTSFTPSATPSTTPSPTPSASSQPPPLPASSPASSPSVPLSVALGSSAGCIALGLAAGLFLRKRLCSQTAPPHGLLAASGSQPKEEYSQPLLQMSQVPTAGVVPSFMATVSVNS